ncbi:hypothetical protein ACFSTD_15275 [Novosphingobium colocasiae]
MACRGEGSANAPFACGGSVVEVVVTQHELVAVRRSDRDHVVETGDRAVDRVVLCMDVAAGAGAVLAIADEAQRGACAEALQVQEIVVAGLVDARAVEVVDEVLCLRAEAGVGVEPGVEV